MAYTCDDLIRWTQQYSPAFKFSKGPNGQNEPFYPVDAEGWLTHQAVASVVEPPSSNPYHRGTALYRWRAAVAGQSPDNWRAILPRIGAGQIQLNAGPSGIRNAEFAQRPPPPSLPEGDWFLDFGGWSEPGTKTYGQMGYTWRFYKQHVYDKLELPSSSQPQEPEPGDLNPAPPARFNPDSRALHSYAEFGPLRTILDQLLDVKLPPELEVLEAGQTKIQGAADQLADFLGLTYYLLYPGYVPPDGKLMEGQWEAVSVFLQDQGRGTLDFRFASYSQGYAGGLFPIPLSACKAAADIEKDGDHPVAYVAFGSHANYFTPRNDEQSLDPGINWGAAIAGGVAAVALVAAGICAYLSGGWWCLIPLAIAILAALLAWLFGKSDDDPVPPPHDQGPRNDTHTGDGAAGGGTSTGTSDAPPIPAPGTAPFIVHPVSADPNIADDRCAPPSWWNYVGRWGVCVDRATAMRLGPSWSNGTWRRWPDGYTLTHRNVEALVDYLSGEIDRKTKTAVTYKP